MNQRIKELAIEAGANLIHDPDRPNDEPLLRLKHLGIEKFAELIVRECMSMHDAPGVYTKTDMFEAIAWNFGIKE